MRSMPVLISAALTLSFAFTATADPDQRTMADRLVSDAKAMGDRGDLQKARELLRRAYAVDPYSETAGNLGRVEMRLGAWRDAAEHLNEALSDLRQTSRDAAKMSKATAWLAQAQVKVLTVRLRVKPEGAVITVLGQSAKTIGESGELEIFVEPGTTQIAAAANGYEGRQETVTGGPGEIKELPITLDLQPAMSSPSPAAPTAPLIDAPIASDRELVFPKDPPAEVERPWWPYAVGGGVTALGLIGGVVFTLDANSNESKYRGISLSPDEGTCGAGTIHGPNCARLSAAADKVAQQRNLAAVSFVAAGAGALATLSYFVWAQVTPTKPSAIRASAAVLPGSAFAVVTGNF